MPKNDSDKKWQERQDGQSFAYQVSGIQQQKSYGQAV
jgi:hypothetical protein